MLKLLLVYRKRLKTSKFSSLNKNLNPWPKPSGKKKPYLGKKRVSVSGYSPNSVIGFCKKVYGLMAYRHIPSF